MGIHEPPVAEIVVAPYVLEQLLARQHEARVLRELAEEPEFGLGEVDRLAATADESLARSHLDVVEHVDVPGGMHRHRTAQRGPYPCRELLADEGLGHVVVRAGFESGDDVVAVHLGGDDDDRDVARLADAATDLEPVHAGQAEVDEDEIRFVDGERGETALAVCGFDDHEALVLEHEAEHLADWAFVFDDEEALGHGVHDGRRATLSGPGSASQPVPGRIVAEPQCSERAGVARDDDDRSMQFATEIIVPAPIENVQHVLTTESEYAMWNSATRERNGDIYWDVPLAFGARRSLPAVLRGNGASAVIRLGCNGALTVEHRVAMEGTGALSTRLLMSTRTSGILAPFVDRAALRTAVHSLGIELSTRARWLDQSPNTRFPGRSPRSGAGCESGSAPLEQLQGVSRELEGGIFSVDCGAMRCLIDAASQRFVRVEPDADLARTISYARWEPFTSAYIDGDDLVVVPVATVPLRMRRAMCPAS